MSAINKSKNTAQLLGFFVFSSRLGARARAVATPAADMTAQVKDGTVTVFDKAGNVHTEAKFYPSMEDLRADHSEISMESPFTFFWRDGKRDVLFGTDPTDAFNRAGYGGGAVAALDFHSSGEDHSWEWVKDSAGKSDWAKSAPAKVA